MSYTAFSALPLSLLRSLKVGTFTLLMAAGCRQAGTPPTTTPAGPDEVNIGYGTVDRRDVTGAVTSLDGRVLQDLRVSHVEELLRDRVPGVHVARHPDGTFSVRIRGARSLLGDHEPLVVVDGVPMGPGALADLLPGNIARIDVLKDAGSAAAYGARGANGVILVTTRQAR